MWSRSLNSGLVIITKLGSDNEPISAQLVVLQAKNLTLP
jgi:hypothetical protein